MNIRIVTSDDWEKFREIRLAGLRTDPQAFGGNLTEESERKEPEWRGWLEGTNRFFVAAEENDVFVSVAGAKQVGDKSWMLIAVHTLSEARGQKLAQRLTGEVMNECRKRGADRMELMVNTDQKDAVHVYEKAGFKIIKTLQDEKMGDGKLYDEFVMEKHFKSKKISLLILGITALMCSRTLFFLFDDPEGPNLLIVTVMALILYFVSLTVYRFNLSLTGLRRLLLAISIQILLATGLCVCLH